MCHGPRVGFDTIRNQNYYGSVRDPLRFLPGRILIASCICMAVNKMPTCMQLNISGKVHRESKATVQLKNQAAGNARRNDSVSTNARQDTLTCKTQPFYTYRE